MEELHDPLASLIEALLGGQSGADRNLTDHLRASASAELLALAEHPSSTVRELLARSLAGREELELAPLLERLAHDSVGEVVTAVAETIGKEQDAPLIRAVSDPVISKLIADADGAIRFATLPAASGRPNLTAQLAGILADDAGWGNRQRAAEVLGGFELPLARRSLLRAAAEDDDEDVARTAALALESTLANEDRRAAAAAQLDGEPLDRLADLARRLGRLGKRRFPALGDWLAGRLVRSVDVATLRRFGTLLSAEEERSRLPRGFYLDRAVEVALEVLEGDGRKALLFYGEPGVGKTAAVFELVHRLGGSERPWHVLRLSPSELLVGTKYLGELETRVQQLIDACQAPRRVLLYVTGIEGLVSAGRSSASDTSVADLLTPHVETGRLAILGEITPEAWKGRFGQSSSFARLFQRVAIEPADPLLTHELLELVAVDAEREVDESFLDRLLELSSYHFSSLKLPGRAVGFLRQVIERGEERRLTVHDLLLTLSQTSGIPVDMLDDDRALDLDATHAFLAAHVMGQDEAISTVLDLVTLVKAGLTDPARPNGVLLFVGPTGVGKTELARALAELLFGSPDRLLRFDMSEYATFEAYERLIGPAGRPGTLTSMVSERPFSVLLFDEIEKAHLNVFDLFLQVFDAGRLTDGAGRTADFRNSIIILTSNLGSATPNERALGFGGEVAPPPDTETIQRELSRLFRPEFLGRLDQTVHFLPLSAETADRIARREVARVLERGGIARRGVTIDVDPAVYSLLLREGYSPALGARPLKRTVERRLLLPIARVLAGGGVRHGAALRVHVRGGEVAVERTSGGEESEREAPPAEAIELAELHERFGALEEAAVVLEERKAEAFEASNAPGFWNDRAGASATLDGIHRLDRLLADLDHLAGEIEITAANRDPVRRAEFVARHELELRRLELLFDAVAVPGGLGDAFVTITRARARRRGLDGVAILARMYRAFAGRLGLESRVLGERRESTPGGAGGVDEVLLAITGPGARVLLAGEEGLHQLQRDRGRRGEPRERELLRVEVDAADEPTLDPEDLRFEERALRGVSGRLIERPCHALRLLHHPSLTSVELWTDLDAGAARAELEPYLAARLARPVDGAVDVVRRYRFGSSPLVRDRRTGYATGRLERVLRGELEPFIGRR